MVYSHQFAAAIKVNGVVLREASGEVAVPFGSEYAIYLKNMASVRAMVKVEIDGTDVTEGSWLVLNPNSNMDLERFIRNGNWNQGNRFKFIKRTGKVEEHRGIKAEDGLIRIEYKFEKMPDPEVHTHHYDHYHHTYDPYYPYYWPTWTWTAGGVTYRGTGVSLSAAQANGGTVVNNAQNFNNSTNVLRSKGAPSASRFCSFDSLGDSDGMIGGLHKSADSTHTANVNTTGSLQPGSKMESSCFTMNFCDTTPVAGAAGVDYREAEVSEDPGITVAGSKSEQKFTSVGWFPTESTSHVLVLKLKGKTSKGTEVKQAVTVKTKVTCSSCGTVNDSDVRYCPDCGTATDLI